MVKIFVIGFIFIFLMSMQIRFIAKSNYFGSFIFAIVISILNGIVILTLTNNNIGHILSYAFGAALGTISGIFIEKNWAAIKKIFKRGNKENFNCGCCISNLAPFHTRKHLKFKRKFK